MSAAGATAAAGSRAPARAGATIPRPPVICQQPHWQGSPGRAESLASIAGCDQPAAVLVVHDCMESVGATYRERILQPCEQIVAACWRHLARLPARDRARLRRAGEIAVGTHLRMLLIGGAQ